MDDPIAWTVKAIREPDKLTGFKDEPFSTSFATIGDAVAYKKEIQSKGWVACVVPEYVSRAARAKQRNKQQMSAFG